jgi:putative transposase
MARQLRIEYPGAFYHVYSRGNQKQPIFYNDEDRFFFIRVLRDAQKRLDAVWCLFCFMANHYHLGLETPAGNLSRIMHFVNSAYTVHLNKKHERCGHLFQGRFKAILVQADRYARTLTKYIHGNPVRKGLLEAPEEYEWSSCRYYFGTAKPPSWLDTRIILECFGGSTEKLKQEHVRYLSDLNDPSVEREFAKAARTGIMGDLDFIERVRRVYLQGRLTNIDPEILELKRLRTRPSLATIKDRVEHELGDGHRFVKKLTIFIAHEYADYRLREIGEFFGLGPSAVHAAFKRINSELEGHETLGRIVRQVKAGIPTLGGEIKKSGKVEV